MASGGPLAFTDVPSPPLPAQQPVQGGGKLLSFRGQPYWRDTSGILWALTATGANAVPWSESGFTGGAAPPGGTTDFLCADGTWQVPAGADSASFSAAADGQGNNGVVVTENPAINSMASGVQASAILAGGITGSPNAISGVVNYSLIDGGYDDVIESTSVGVLKIGGAHNRIFGNSASHSAIHWGSFHVLENGSYAVISGGTGHTVASDGAVIAGGESNTIPPSSQEAAVGGGSANVAYGAFSTVAGGTAGYTGANEATVSGGSANENFGQYGVIGGGNANQIGDGLAVTDGAITASTNTLACHTSTPFASPVVAGSTVIVLGAGPAPSHTTTGSVAARGVPLVTTIATITDTGDVVLNATAATTVSGATVIIITGDGSGSSSVIGGGTSNTVGKTAVSQYATIVGGRSNDAEANYATVLGGQGNKASAVYATAAGVDALADLYGSLAHAQGQFAAQGDNQWMLIHPWRQIVNLTSATELRLDGSGTRLTLNTNNTAWRFKGEVLAKQTGGITVNAWHIEGVIAMGAGASTTVMKWSAVDVLYGDSATAALTATADVTNGALSVQFTDSGGGAVTWDVGADIQIRKVAG